MISTHISRPGFRAHSSPCTGYFLGMLLVAVLGMLMMPGASAAESAPAAFKTAAEHAGFAAQADKLAIIQLHLHHVLNCLEGSHSKDFDAKAGDPCKGESALAGLQRGTANWARAQKSIALARVGVTLHDEAPAHYVAEAVHAILMEGVK